MPRTEIVGMRDLERMLRQLGQVPQKCVTPAARAGARIALKDAKGTAPEETGALKQGLVLNGERTRARGKKVYQVTFSAAMNDIFVKYSKEGERSYYPASQEYGFMAVNGRYIPGYHYLKRALDHNRIIIRRKIIDVVGKEVDKLLR